MTVEMKVEVEVPDQVFEVQVGQVGNITIQHLLALCQEVYNKLENRKHPKWIRVMIVEMLMVMKKKMMILMAEEAGMTLLIHQGVCVIYINSR
jgi:hypothetical protein